MVYQSQRQIDLSRMAVAAANAAPAVAQGESLFSALTGLVGHGDLISLLDQEAVATRVSPLLAARQRGSGFSSSAAPMSALMALQVRVTYFFNKLINDPYVIPTNLMSAIVFPIDGATHTPKEEEAAHPDRRDSVDVPAAFTFVGQFIDHDLTANAFDLFLDQTGTIPDSASPLIDLDSVYGPRVGEITSPSNLDTAKLFDAQGRFFLVGGNGAPVDVPRRTRGDMKGQPFIADKRNDENQLILQVHLLLMKLHNRLINEHGMSFADAHRHTVYTWQSLVLHDYLPKVADPNIVAAKATAAKTGDFANLVHKPYQTPSGVMTVAMPHEFAIGFRFGHSQLRPAYKLNSGPAVPLFNNRIVAQGGQFADLRGNQPLTTAREIDWDVFLVGSGSPAAAQKSKLIDGKVTSVVFDLPESTIPDNVKAVGNLPHRNLIRSNQIGLASGEDLAKLYNVAPLTAAEVEPDAELQKLYAQSPDGRFRTPLWFYMLREAETRGRSGRLGDAGSSLVAEVITGGIYYNQPLLQDDGTTAPPLILPDDFTSLVNGKRIVTLFELAKYVSGPANEQLIGSDPWVEP